MYVADVFGNVPELIFFTHQSFKTVFQHDTTIEKFQWFKLEPLGKVADFRVFRFGTHWNQIPGHADQFGR